MGALALLALGAYLVMPYLLEGYAALPRPVRSGDPHVTAKFAFLYAVLVWMVVCNLFPFVNRALRWNVLLYFGGISYAVYMFHLPVVELLDQLYNAKVIGSRLLVEVLFWAIVIGAAELSRRFLEAPFERMKERFPLPPPAQALERSAAAEKV